MKLHQLKPKVGSKKRRKRLGRGNGSGLGTYSGKGMKGQKSRSGASFHPSFEGGKTPLIKQIPKIKGFKSIKNKPEVITLEQISKKFKTGDIIEKKILKQKGLINSVKSKVKLIGNSDIKAKFTVMVDASSQAAVKKIESAGGSIKVFKSNPKVKDNGKTK